MDDRRQLISDLLGIISAALLIAFVTGYLRVSEEPNGVILNINSAVIVTSFIIPRVSQEILFRVGKRKGVLITVTLGMILWVSLTTIVNVAFDWTFISNYPDDAFSRHSIVLGLTLLTAPFIGLLVAFSMTLFRGVIRTIAKSNRFD